MAFSAILRRSVATLAPAGARILRIQKHKTQASSPLIRPAAYSSSAAVKMIQCALEAAEDQGKGVEVPKIQCAVEEAEDQGKGKGVEVPKDFPFEIKDIPGQQTISLSGTYQTETITVVVDMPDIFSEGGAEDENESVSESSLPMVVQISKKSGGPYLEFRCTATTDEITIDTSAVKDPEATEDQIAYEGPDFTDLDENLMKDLYKYLEIRGIKPSTTSFLLEYMISKGSREYLIWLKNLKSFIEP